MCAHAHGWGGGGGAFGNRSLSEKLLISVDMRNLYVLAYRSSAGTLARSSCGQSLQQLPDCPVSLRPGADRIAIETMMMVQQAPA